MESIATITLGAFALAALAVAYLVVESALAARSRYHERGADSGAWM